MFFNIYKGFGKTVEVVSFNIVAREYRPKCFRAVLVSGNIDQGVV